MTNLSKRKRDFLEVVLEEEAFGEVRLTSYETNTIRNVLTAGEYSNKQAKVINSVRKDYIYWMKGL